MKTTCPPGSTIFSVKVSYKFDYQGYRDDPSDETIKSSKNLSRNSEEAEIIDEMIDEFRTNGIYKITSNKFGYVAIHEKTDYYAFKATFDANPIV